jgi:hypothetical protein
VKRGDDGDAELFLIAVFLLLAITLVCAVTIEGCVEHKEPTHERR